MGCGGKRFTINANLHCSNMTMPILRSYMLSQTCFLQCGPVFYPAYGQIDPQLFVEWKLHNSSMYM